MTLNQAPSKTKFNPPPPSFQSLFLCCGSGPATREQEFCSSSPLNGGFFVHLFLNFKSWLVWAKIVQLVGGVEAIGLMESNTIVD